MRADTCDRRRYCRRTRRGRVKSYLLEREVETGLCICVTVHSQRDLWEAIWIPNVHRHGAGMEETLPDPEDEDDINSQELFTINRPRRPNLSKTGFPNLDGGSIKWDVVEESVRPLDAGQAGGGCETAGGS